MKRFFIPSAAIVTLMVLTAAIQAEQHRRHECVEAKILRSPRSVQQGKRFRVRVGIKNCSHSPTDLLTRYPVHLYLVSEGRRIPVGRTHVGVAPGERVRRNIRAHVPRNVRPGDYRLQVVVKAPNGFIDTDSAPIRVVRDELAELATPRS